MLSIEVVRDTKVESLIRFIDSWHHHVGLHFEDKGPQKVINRGNPNTRVDWLGVGIGGKAKTDVCRCKAFGWTILFPCMFEVFHL